MDEKYHEQAANLELERRDEALRLSRNSLQGKGQARCEDCREPIPRERRKAAPNAIRCMACQTVFEKFKGRKT